MRSRPEVIRSLRLRAGHTTRSLAVASGVSQQRISDLESGPQGVWPSTAKKLADALGCHIADIVDMEIPA